MNDLEKFVMSCRRDTHVYTLIGDISALALQFYYHQ